MASGFQGRFRFVVRTGVGQSFARSFLVVSLAAALVGAGPSFAGEVTLEERLSILKDSYPDAIKSISSSELVFHNGKRFAIDDRAEKNHQQKLKGADIEDMLSQIYPIGACATGKPARNFDPGRIRNDEFSRNLFGRSKAEAGKQMLRVKWFGKALRFNRVGGAARALQRVGDDLRRLGKDFGKFYRKSAGTFVWRKISGTNRLSAHSFGAAIDIAVKQADYWRWSGGKPGNVPRYRNKIPLEIVDVFERHGFIWGGKWYHYDTMHFEYRPDLIAIGRLAEQRGCVSK